MNASRPRVLVNSDCSVPGHPSIFVIGDAMRMADPMPLLPGVSQVALQQGRYVGQMIAARVGNRPAPPPFRYKDKGNNAAMQALGSLKNGKMFLLNVYGPKGDPVYGGFGE